MSLLPPRPWGGSERSDRPHTTIQVRRSEEERRFRLEVQAARWRALELARANFGEEARGSLMGVRRGAPWCGLLHLAVPFEGAERQRSREARFIAMASADPLLARVPLLFVFAATDDR